MRGKLGLVVGLGVGYVLGTRAGRERYAQIKEKAAEVWELDIVQDQVEKAKKIATSSALAVPRMAWNGAIKVVKAATASGTPGQRLDAALGEADDAAEDVKATAKAAAKDGGSSNKAAS